MNWAYGKYREKMWFVGGIRCKCTLVGALNKSVDVWGICQCEEYSYID